MITFHPKNSLYALLGIILLLLLLHLGSFYYVTSNGLPPSNEIFEELNFGKEKNIPAIFSAGLLFIASVLLAITGSSKLKMRNKRMFWFSLSFIFFFLGFDELLRIHEKIDLDMHVPARIEGIFHYSWVIPYGTALILMTAVIIRPLFELPKRTLYGFILAGILFVGGALGMEMFTGWYLVQENITRRNLDLIPEVFLMYTLEELLEMTGVSIFIFFILDFLKNYRRETHAEPIEPKFKWKN